MSDRHVVRIVPSADGSWRAIVRPDTASPNWPKVDRPRRDRAAYMRRYRELNGRPSRAKGERA